MNVNDDKGLEKEADVMGTKTAQLIRKEPQGLKSDRNSLTKDPGNITPTTLKIIQAVWIKENPQLWRWDIPVSGVQWYTDGNYYWFDCNDGSVYRDFAGLRNKHTYAEWKELGAGDLPEADIHYEAMHELRKENSPVVWGPITMVDKDNKALNAKSKSTQFYRWLFNDLPNPTLMNCYEVVLYAAVQAKIRTKEYVKAMIALDRNKGPMGGPEFATHFNKPNQAYLIDPKLDDKQKAEFLKDKLWPIIPRGWVVMFGPQGEHFALSVGVTEEGKHLVLELDQKTGGVSIASIEEITEKYRFFSWGPMP